MQGGQQQMAYDRAITVFSPDGRLFQVEYAREAVKRGTTAVGIKSEKGVALIVDRRITSELMEPTSVEKIFVIDDHVGAATSGLVADARVLVDKARMEAQINRISYDEAIQIESLVKKICDFKQNYTQYGGVRPFGSSFLVGGIEDGVPSLFETDPSGAFIEVKASGIGSGREEVTEFFEENYREDVSLHEAVVLGLRALAKAGVELSPGSVEIGLADVEESRFSKLPEEEAEKYVDEAKEVQSSEEGEEGEAG